MIEPRLAAHMLVSSLIRRANAQGDFATVLRRGDETAGNILIVALEKGANPRLFERFPALDGPAIWSQIPSQTIDKYSNISEYCARRSGSDPDLWILELDVAFQQRLDGLLELDA
jgi:hypothetical protein